VSRCSFPYPVFFVIKVGSAFVEIFFGTLRSAVFITIAAHPNCYNKQSILDQLEVLSHNVYPINLQNIEITEI